MKWFFSMYILKKKIIIIILYKTSFISSQSSKWVVNYCARPRPDCKDDEVNWLTLLLLLAAAAAATLVDAVLLLRGAKLSDSLWNSNGITPRSPAYRFLATCPSKGKWTRGASSEDIFKSQAPKWNKKNKKMNPLHFLIFAAQKFQIKINWINE